MEPRIYITTAAYVAALIAGIYEVRASSGGESFVCESTSLAKIARHDFGRPSNIVLHIAANAVVTSPTAAPDVSFIPKTNLGRRLLAYRLHALRNGMVLSSLDEVNRQVSRDRSSEG